MTKPARLVLVAAVAENGVIGRDRGMPWHLPGDLKRFKAITLGKPILMGRRTYESIGRPLPGRSNIVLTRDRDFKVPGVRVVANITEALAIAGKEAERLNADEIAVIGGATLYAETLAHADRLYFTEVHASTEGTVRFPDFDRSEWREATREGPFREPGEPHSYSFVVLERT